MILYVERTKFTDDVFIKKELDETDTTKMLHIYYPYFKDLFEMELKPGEVKKIKIEEV